MKIEVEIQEVSIRGDKRPESGQLELEEELGVSSIVEQSKACSFTDDSCLICI